MCFIFASCHNRLHDYSTGEESLAEEALSMLRGHYYTIHSDDEVVSAHSYRQCDMIEVLQKIKASYRCDG